MCVAVLGLSLEMSVQMDQWGGSMVLTPHMLLPDLRYECSRVSRIPGKTLLRCAFTYLLRDRSLFMTGGGTGVKWLFARNFFTAYYACGGKDISTPTLCLPNIFWCLLFWPQLEIFSTPTHFSYQEICSLFANFEIHFIWGSDALVRHNNEHLV